MLAFGAALGRSAMGLAVSAALAIACAETEGDAPVAPEEADGGSAGSLNGPDGGGDSAADGGKGGEGSGGEGSDIDSEGGEGGQDDTDLTASACEDLCEPETDEELCLQQSANCGTLQTGDSCGTPRVIESCGTCQDPLVCAGAGIVNQCAEPLTGAWSFLTSPNSITTAHLNGVWVTPEGEAWIAGDRGTLLHWDGSMLTQVATALDVDLSAVWGSSPTDVWVSGSRRLMHYDGSEWSLLPSPTNGDMIQLTGTGPDDIWVTAEVSGSVYFAQFLHFDGSTWSAACSMPGYDRHHRLAAAAKHRVFSVDQNGAGLDFDGTKWLKYQWGSTYEVFDEEDDDYDIVHDSAWDIHAASPDEVWAVGRTYVPSSDGSLFDESPLLMRRQEDTWVPVLPVDPDVPVELTSIWFEEAAEDIWVASDVHHDQVTYYPYQIARYSTASQDWTAFDVGSSINDISGSGDDILAVGPRGFVTRWDGGVWQPLSERAAPSYCGSIHGASKTEVWAACEDSLQHWNGSLVETVTVPDMLFNKTVWVADVGDVWALTTSKLWSLDALVHGVDGTWEVLDVGISPYLITGSGKDDVWMLDDGRVLRHDSGDWLDISPAVSVGKMYDLWVRAPTDAWLMTDQGPYRWDGESWTSHPIPGVEAPPVGDKQKVHGSSETNVWALTTKADYTRELYHWNAESATWELGMVVPPTGVRELWVTGDSDLYLGGQAWTDVYHSNGSFASPIGKWNGDLFWAEGTLFVAGDHGIARYQ